MCLSSSISESGLGQSSAGRRNAYALCFSARCRAKLYFAGSPWRGPWSASAGNFNPDRWAAPNCWRWPRRGRTGGRRGGGRRGGHWASGPCPCCVLDLSRTGVGLRDRAERCVALSPAKFRRSLRPGGALGASSSWWTPAVGYARGGLVFFSRGWRVLRRPLDGSIGGGVLDRMGPIWHPRMATPLRDAEFGDSGIALWRGVDGGFRMPDSVGQIADCLVPVGRSF